MQDNRRDRSQTDVIEIPYTLTFEDIPVRKGDFGIQISHQVVRVPNRLEELARSRRADDGLIEFLAMLQSSPRAVSKSLDWPMADVRVAARNLRERLKVMFPGEAAFDDPARHPPLGPLPPDFDA